MVVVVAEGGPVTVLPGATVTAVACAVVVMEDTADSVPVRSGGSCRDSTGFGVTDKMRVLRRNTVFLRTDISGSKRVRLIRSYGMKLSK